ncbi:hypothetical protein [Streptomyces venezuelae]|uniref:hypothetical protein n=1 Tax=Streptomyces venezuelae TaxID=54571 RepID=UPI0011AB7865|nr:hypothetical protein [Streptomyces venezuelae]
MDRAGPGIEEQADQVAEAACELADATAGSGWSMVAVDDALVAIDALAPALAQVDQEVAEVLAATATVRRRFGLSAEPDPAPPCVRFTA